jgi:hypothetical protein
VTWLALSLAGSLALNGYLGLRLRSWRHFYRRFQATAPETWARLKYSSEAEARKRAGLE